MISPRRGIPAMAPRYVVQGGFFLFYLWIGWRFTLWVTALQQGQIPDVSRPAAVDGFLPISGLMGLRHWVQTGALHPIHPAAALILVAALLTALLLKRGFCSWVCPVFPLSEILWRLGQRLTGRTFAPPFWLDLPLRSLKYLLLGFFTFQILWLMPLPGLRAFLSAPYHKIADIRMLLFFQHPSATFLVFLGVMVLLSLFVQMPWCRYLCPYGALLGLFSMLSFSKIRRNEHYCIRCGLCSSRCTAWLPVMHKRVVRSAECYGCYRCVQNCPAPGALQMQVLGRYTLKPVLFGLVLLALFVGTSLYGHLSHHWQSQGSPQEIIQLLQTR